MSTSSSSNTNMKNRQQTRDNDGPTTTFESDPLLIHLTNTNNDEDNEDTKFFSLVLVAGWPSDISSVIEEPYQQLLNLTKQCCHEANISEDEYLYLYPPKFLHVTVATISLLEPFDTNQAERYDQQQHDYTHVIQNASKDLEWPTTKKFELEIDKIQFGLKAGIILWKEKTGGLQTVRRLIKKYAEEESSNLSIHAIPGIVHTTFVRYRKTILPTEGGKKLHDMFQSKIVHNDALKLQFPTTIYIKSIKLVCERKPYMHIPNDNHHVFLQV